MINKPKANKLEWWAESEQTDAHCIRGWSWLGFYLYDSFCRIKFIPRIQDVRTEDYDIPFHCKACIRGIEEMEYYINRENERVNNANTNT